MIEQANVPNHLQYQEKAFKATILERVDFLDKIWTNSTKKTIGKVLKQMRILERVELRAHIPVLVWAGQHIHYQKSQVRGQELKPIQRSMKTMSGRPFKSSTLSFTSKNKNKLCHVKQRGRDL